MFVGNARLFHSRSADTATLPQPPASRRLQRRLRLRLRNARQGPAEHSELTITLGADTSGSIADRLQQAYREVLAPIYERIDEFRRLPANWDSYDANPISAVAVEHARLIALAAIRENAFDTNSDSYSLRAFPLAEGGIQLEWESSHAYLEVEVGSDGRLSYLFRHQPPLGRSESATDVEPARVLERIRQTVTS
jgi:hypothetical protein